MNDSSVLKVSIPREIRIFYLIFQADFQTQTSCPILKRNHTVKENETRFGD
jgi:hypothetical protein